nr:MAG TPA: hypothetical protein [Caudoviricetes sp.]
MYQHLHPANASVNQNTSSFDDTSELSELIND